MRFSRRTQTAALLTLSTLSQGLAQSLPENWPSEIVLPFTPKAELALDYPLHSIDNCNAGSRVLLESAAPDPALSLNPSLPGPLVVIMIDPDAPTPQRPTSAQILHYLHTDLRPQDGPDENGLGEGMLDSEGPPIVPYRGPGPPPGSDTHRYIFLVFEQPAGFFIPAGLNPDERRGFNLSEFKQITGLGEPIAGQFFLAQWGDPGTEDEELLRGNETAPIGSPPVEPVSGSVGREDGLVTLGFTMIAVGIVYLL